MIEKVHFILYVRDQEASTTFYARVLDTAPALHVPGMTEFALGENVVLGLMPQQGIINLLGSAVGELGQWGKMAGAEVYLVVTDPAAYHQRALAAGAHELSGLALRNWGDEVAYSADLDGYILAFAHRVT
ncbi:MAG: glyoxalase [Caldilinea sp. CFX5]|nr:glyoxalase [Caldilinea sp. CFX5]